MSQGVVVRLTAAMVVVNQVYWAVPETKGRYELSTMRVTGPMAWE